MTKTVQGIRRKNELKAAELLKGKCRTIIVRRKSDNTSEVDIYGIDMKDWRSIKGKMHKLARA